MNELVTVIITTYKRPIAIVQRALESVINQTYSAIEIIIVNDYPEDTQNAQAIKDLIETYNNHNIFYLEPKHNSGACVARNLGIEKGKGKYISFLDDDDYWLDNKLEVQINGFQNRDVGVVYTPFYRNYNDQKEIMPSLEQSGMITEYLLYSYNIGIFPLSRMSLVKEIGGFDPELPSSQDYDFFLRLSTRSKFQFVEIPTAVYDVSEISISTNVNKKIQGFEIFMKKHSELYDKYPHAKHYQLVRMVNNMITSGQYKYAWGLYKKSVMDNLFSLSNIVEPLKGIMKRINGRESFH